MTNRASLYSTRTVLTMVPVLVQGIRQWVQYELLVPVIVSTHTVEVDELREPMSATCG